MTDCVRSANDLVRWRSLCRGDKSAFIQMANDKAQHSRAGHGPRRGVSSQKKPSGVPGQPSTKLRLAARRAVADADEAN